MADVFKIKTIKRNIILATKRLLSCTKINKQRLYLIPWMRCSGSQPALLRARYITCVWRIYLLKTTAVN